ncbi:MAG: diphosphomevalonate decarboxylase [Bacteroidales bacterium]
MDLATIFEQEAYMPDATTLPVGWQQSAWSSPSNIALIKYWGKYPGQIPASPSLSFSLSACRTYTVIRWKKAAGPTPEVRFFFDGQPQPAFQKRVTAYINSIKRWLPWLSLADLEIDSRNTFPYGAGIASSASAFSSLALSLLDIDRQLRPKEIPSCDFFRKASFLARVGSGSAARSVFKGLVLWGRHPEVEDSSDEIAIPLNGIKQPFRWGDLILITHAGEKKVSSSAGHRLMENHPFAEARYRQAGENISSFLKALRENDRNEMIKIIEQEALTLHALMLSAQPGFTLLNDRSWKLIESIRNFREKTGLTVAFTLDAGPNVHLLYDLSVRDKVLLFAEKELKQFCSGGYLIDDQEGSGPEPIKNSDETTL